MPLPTWVADRLHVPVESMKISNPLVPATASHTESVVDARETSNRLLDVGATLKEEELKERSAIVAKVIV